MSSGNFSRVLPVPVGDEVVELSLDDLPADIEDYVQVLREERCPAPFWLKLASECGARKRMEDCESVLNSAIQTLTSIPPPENPYRSRRASDEEIAPFHAMLSSFQLMRARSCPKVILSDAKYQNLRVNSPQIQSKERYTQLAATHANSIIFPSPTVKGTKTRHQAPTLKNNLLLGRGIYLAITADTEEALKCFRAVLESQSRNPIALLGLACCLLRKREYQMALSIYQEVLRISIAQSQKAAKESAIVGPDGELVENQASKWLGPDPRIGIGLCLQGLGRLGDARRAWKRAIAVNPTNAAPHLLLGLSLLNAAKQLPDLGPDLATLAETETDARALAYREGLSHVEISWKLDNKNAMTAIVLAEHFCVRALATSSADQIQAQKDYERSLKLGEHAIQYADNKAAVNQAWLIFARTAHLYSFLDETSTSTVELRSIAQRYYTRAAEDFGRSTSAAGDANAVSAGYAMAILGLAQLQLSRGESLGAMNTMEAIMIRPGSSKSMCLELTLMAGSLRAHSHPGAIPTEKLSDRSRARVLLDRALRTIEACKGEMNTLGEELREVDVMLTSSEVDPHSNLELARVALADENLGKVALEQIHKLGNDELTYVQMSELLQQDKDSRPGDSTRAIQTLITALQVIQTKQKNHLEEISLEADILAIRLQANLGALLGLKGMESVGELAAQCLLASIDQLQKSLGSAGKSSHTASLDAEKTTALYNLARVLEASGSVEDAQKAYDAVLANHPEYADAKVRQALMIVCAPLARGNREATQLANTLFKEALTSDPLNLDTRSAFVCFLSGELPGSPNPPQWESIKENIAQLFMGASSSQAVQLFGNATAAKAVTDEARRDAYTLSALAWAYYNIGHSIKPGANAKSERLRAMLRCCDLLDKALIEDRHCAFALQGLAILLAEGSMIDMTNPNSASNTSEVDLKKRKAAEEAIGLLTKLREVNEGSSVHICMGHAYMSRDDYNRALKSYELASKREAPKPSLLQYLSKATFQLGMEMKSYDHLQKSIDYLDQAIELLKERTSGSAAAEVKFLRYNIGVTRQKMMQILFELPIEQREMTVLKSAIDGIGQAQLTFKDLTQDAIDGKLSYISGEIIEQRQMYGEILLKQSEKHLEEQKMYEDETREKREAAAARKREREEAIEKERVEKEEIDRARAEELAEERRKAIEEARTWEYYHNEIEEKPKKSRKSGGGGEGGKRRKGKKKRKDEEGASEIESSESEAGAAFPESEDDDMIVSDEAEIEQGDLSENELERKRDDARAERREAKRKEKRTRRGEKARKGSGAIEEDSESEDRPAKKPKKSKMRRAVEEDLIESDEEV